MRAFNIHTQLTTEQKEEIIQYISDLRVKEKRAKALVELAK